MEQRSIYRILFLSLGHQWIVLTIVILVVTMESYGDLVRFLIAFKSFEPLFMSFANASIHCCRYSKCLCFVKR